MIKKFHSENVSFFFANKYSSVRTTNVYLPFHVGTRKGTWKGTYCCALFLHFTSLEEKKRNLKEAPQDISDTDLTILDLLESKICSHSQDGLAM